MVTQQHFCKLHQTKFFRNEKKDQSGDLKVWYSHKLLNGNGFCVEKPNTASEQTPSSYMLMCNAMNNAIALAASGKIGLDQIGSYYRKILTELQNTIH